MKSKKTQELFQYWNRLRGDRVAPKRTEIEPADIKTLLADTFILEKDARGEAVFRLAGTRICSIFGRELKGYSFPSLWPNKEAGLITRLLNETFTTNQAVLVGFEGVSRNNRVAQFEMIVLMLDGGRDNPRAIGALAALDPQFWLGADPLVHLHARSIRIIDPMREPMFLKNRPAVDVPALEPDSAEVTPLPVQSEGRVRRFRHLVVLPGGKDIETTD